MSLLHHLPLEAPLAEYETQVQLLLAGHARGDAHAIRLLHHCLPRFLDPVTTWKPLPISDDEILTATITIDDARLAVARGYSLQDWVSLVAIVTAIQQLESPVRAFELAAEAVISGEIGALRAMLTDDTALIRARSTRVTCHDPAVHGATLLHYIGANGIEGYRQRTPKNIVEIAKVLLDAGAEVDALAGMYGGQCTTLSMLISSSIPRQAGLHLPLLNLLLDRGAAPNGVGASKWSNPLRTALIFGYLDAAELMAARGARVDTLPLAAGLGRTDLCARLLSAATPDERHEAFALASNNGQLEAVTLLLDFGEDPNRFNPDGMHAHQTPLHGAALAGNLPLVQLLVRRGARKDIVDPLWGSAALGWARHGGNAAVVAWLEGDRSATT